MTNYVNDVPKSESPEVATVAQDELIKTRISRNRKVPNVLFRVNLEQQ